MAVSIGTFISENLAAGKRQVAKTRNRGGYGAIYPATARAVLVAYPALTDSERETVFATLTSDAREVEKTMKLHFSGALGSVSRILGIPRIRSKVQQTPVK